MKRKAFVTICVLVILCLFSGLTRAHTYRISVIVDTDMALDDIRALSMLLNSDMAAIPLVVVSDGASSPEAGCLNLARLLRYFKKEEIMIAKGKISGKPAPPWRPWSEKINWPDNIKNHKQMMRFSPAPEAIVNVLNAANEPMLYLCLGPLTNLSKALSLRPDISDKITRIIYYGGHPDDSKPGWNTRHDPEAARSVFNAGISVYAMSLHKEKLLHFDLELLHQIGKIQTSAARLVKTIHSDSVVNDLLREKHCCVWDEMLVIFLSNPSLFRFVPSVHENVMTLDTYRVQAMRNAYLKLLNYSGDFHLHSRNSVVLKNFPTDPSIFKKDVSPCVKPAIEKYGLEEWKACFLTSELHRHLGIYSLIGAKMGIRAREILEAPFDTLEVVSLAGNSPPLSCMNDGLQVSTGASLGRGAIRVSGDSSEPSAIFTYDDQKIMLTIKKDVVNQIKRDIKATLETYGGLSNEYFAHIRKLSLNYWLELDRTKIFDEIHGPLTSDQAH